MIYTLMNKNNPVIDFETQMGTILRITDTWNEEYLPIGTRTKTGIDVKILNHWWHGRSIPASRTGIKEALENMGIDSSKELLEKSYGLSLSDQYWIRPDHSKIQWKDINFFENPFSEDVGSALFGGQFSGDFMSPDNTSDGWLRKKWVIQNQRRVLLKSGSGESQQEPLNEVLANMICDRLDIKNYVKYQCGYQEDHAFSACDNFITPDTELITANMFMKIKKKINHHSYYQHYKECCQEMGVDITESLDDMLILDLIICNRDRHYNNFGMIRNVNTLQIEKAAPIFDSGTSAFAGISENKIKTLPLNESKPFCKYHEEQIALIQNIERYEFQKLTGLEEEFNKEVFGVHLKPLKLDESVDLDLLARQTPGFSAVLVLSVALALPVAEEPLSLLPHAAREPTSIAAVSSIANFFFIKLSSSFFSYKSTMLCIALY